MKSGMIKRAWTRAFAGASGLALRLVTGLPDRVLVRIFGRPPLAAADLAPDAWALARLGSMAEGEPEAPTAESRFASDCLADAVAARGTGEVAAVDRSFEGPGGPLPVRIYRPCAPDSESHEIGEPLATQFTGSESLPGTVFLHGGGWANGSLLSHDRTCRRLAHLVGAVVIAVDYRLAPENPYPAGLDDALAAWRQVKANPAEFGIDPDRIGIAGDSSGANLAAAVCLALREAGEEQPLVQTLIYPALDLAGHHPSVDAFGSGFQLRDTDMTFYKDMYVPDRASRADPLVSPLLADDLSRLASAHVITALADPLRDEGELYAGRLKEAGVEVTLDRVHSTHGWFNMTAMRSSRAGFDLVAARLRHTFTMAR